MKRLSLVLLMITGVLFASESVSPAGVVMSEIAVENGPSGSTARHQTVYVQGNKQKIQMQGIDTITDLDRQMIYVINEKQHAYVEMPLASQADMNNDSKLESISLSATGEKDVIANHPCDVYSGSQTDADSELSVSACVSATAPGASEVANFERRMMSQLGAKPRNPHHSTGVMLETRSVLKVKLPDRSETGYRVASVSSETRVREIRVEPLSADTFRPPKGFNRLHPRGDIQQQLPPDPNAKWV